MAFQDLPQVVRLLNAIAYFFCFGAIHGVIFILFGDQMKVDADLYMGAYIWEKGPIGN